jgi:tRNA nucleotidyltransferase (CCA-adding enzyme)
MARERMKALKYPTDRTDRVTDLVKHHMYAPFKTPKGARRFLNRVGDHADDLFNIRIADQGGKHQYPAHRDEEFNVASERDLVRQVRESNEPTGRSQLAINGKDLIDAGIPQGPQVGQVLNTLTEAVMDNPQLNTREQLLQLAQQHGG